MIWVTEPTSPRGATTTAPWQRTPATLAGTLTAMQPNNAGTSQRTVSASGRLLLAVLVCSIYQRIIKLRKEKAPQKAHTTFSSL